MGSETSEEERRGRWNGSALRTKVGVKYLGYLMMGGRKRSRDGKEESDIFFWAEGPDYKNRPQIKGGFFCEEV